MFENISLQYPTWYILLCVLIASVFTMLLYYKDKRFVDRNRIFPLVLSALRFIAVFGISILLLNPLVKRYTQDKKQPLVIIVEDISKSISFKQPDLLDKTHEALSNMSIDLQDQFEIKNLYFGSKIGDTYNDSTVIDASNISNVFEHISEHYSSDNVGAVILSSDGIFNQGNNPIYTNSKVSAPVYTIALGDTSQNKDILIKNVFHNKIAYLGNEFIAQVDVQAFNLNGKQSKLEVYSISNQSARKKVLEKRITIDNHHYFKTLDIKLKADKAGLNQFRIVLNGVEDELTLENNSKDVYVDVLDLKQKVLILAQAPHPDLSAIKSTLSINENYQIDIDYIQSNKKRLNSYDLVVFHNLPSNGYNLTKEIKTINDRKIPRMFIVGTAIDHSQFNKVQDCIESKGNRHSLSDVQAKVEQNFRSFIIDEETQKQITKFPPLINNFGEYKLLPGSNALLTQKISKIETNYPLLAYREEQGIKTGILVGEGIWKWKLFNYLENNNNDVLNQLLTKNFQFLTVKNDKRKLRVETSKKLYNENESILFSGQLFNDNYELINDPELNLKVSDTEGNDYQFVFSRVENYYILDTKQLPEGRYRFTANCIVESEKLEYSSRFSVKSIQLELYDLTARHNILQQLSDQSKGQMFYLNQTNELIAAIKSNRQIKPIVYTSETSESIINYKLILGLLLLLLILEWFMRRLLGSY